MSEKPEYIQIEAGEDVPSVRDRLSFIRGRRVLLIWPEEGTALRRKLDLVLIQREANRRVIQLALVTHDPQVIQHARELGISTYETIGESERNRWKRGRTRVFLPRHHKPKHEPDPDELMPVASRVRRPRKRISQLRYLATRTLALLVGIALIAATAYLTLPYAEVRFVPEWEVLTTTSPIVVDPDATTIDIDNGVIPATRITATVQTVASLPTSGTQALDATLATGVVTFTNQTAREITVEAGTIVTTSAGTPIQFRTTQTITLAAGRGERADVPIEALSSSAGVRGNVDIGAINIVASDLSEEVTVLNLAATTGGDNRSQALVTAEDRQRLLGLTRGQLQALAYSEMQVTLSDTQVIVLETVQIAEERVEWTRFSHNPGDATDTLTLDMEAIVEAYAIDDRFAEQVIFSRLAAVRPAGLLLQADSYSYQRGTVTADEQVILTASGSARASAQVDNTRLQQQLIGQQPSAVPEIISVYVNLAPETSPSVIVQPEWLPTMPLLPMRIFIIEETDT